MCRPSSRGAAQASAHPLDDQVALEFRNRSDDDHDRPAQWPSGIDLLAEADELDVEPVQLIENFQEVFHRAGDPIRSPDQQDLEAAVAGIAHHLIQAGSLDPGTTDPVGILLDDLIAPLLSHLAEVVELGLRVLIEGGHTQIEGLD